MLALALIAALIAFFPILTNTMLGLKSADFNLLDSGAALWRLALADALQSSAALGAAVSAERDEDRRGVALIGEVMAEFVAGSGTATGLAWRITESSNRLEIATMFAALVLLAILGVAIFAALSLLEWLLLRRWHESAVGR